MTTLKEIKTDKKRRKDGIICVVDSCHPFASAEHYKVDGEFCSECDCGFHIPTKVTDEIVDEINTIRLKYGEAVLE